MSYQCPHPECGKPLSSANVVSGICPHCHQVFDSPGQQEEAAETEKQPVPPPSTTPPPAGNAPVKGTQPQVYRKASNALICSIAGFFICLFVGAILGIVFGTQAQQEIDNSQGELTGRGYATAAIVLGGFGLLFDLIILVAVVIPEIKTM
jgi:hypothetical protein